jgi:Ca2+-binding EF-hand superfamily protein
MTRDGIRVLARWKGQTARHSKENAAMTKKSLTIAIVTALCGAPLLAGAQPGGGPGKWGKPSFEQLDTDKNGSVSPAELQAEVNSHFAQFDTNKDGKVTKQEAEAFFASKRAEHEKMRGEHEQKHAEREQARFAERDTNKDGKLSKQELARMPGDWFERLDLNGDGFVTPDEMKEAHAAMKEGFEKGMAERGAGMFDKLDTDKNGAVDKNEIAAHAKQRFDKLDADKNGVLSKDELSAQGCGGHKGFGHGGRGMHSHADRT